MSRIPLVFALSALLAAGACTQQKDTSHLNPSNTSPGTPGAEPDRIAVDHILISFAGAGTSAKRSKADAEKLALELLTKLKAGGNWASTKKEYSDDPPPGGPYGLYQKPAARKPGDFPRAGMVPAFGNVGFKLNLNEIGLANYDAATSQYGWHIIKRVE